MQDWTVSLFNNVIDTIPKDISLLEWLQMTKDPPEHYKKLVENYQDNMTRKFKEKIPCISIHASFHTHRGEENIQQKNNLICIDIDRKENKCIDMQLAKELLSQHPSTFYAGFSVSGEFNGVYAIIVIGENDRLIDYFESFKERFAKIGINIDNKCKDYARLRFFNIDTEAYFNIDAKPFKLKPKQKEEEKKPAVKKEYKPNAKEDFERITNADKVYRIIEQVEKQGIDITADYNDWFKIGAALNQEFGEDGRSMFHRLSSNHPKYNAKECDTKFDNCKKLNKISFNSLFYIATSYGVKY